MTAVADIASRPGIPLPTDAELGPRAAAVRRSGDLNVSRMLAGTGGLFEAATGFVKALFTELRLDAPTRELLILRTAWLLDCPYERQANEAMARNAGCTPAQIAAMREADPSAALSGRASLVIRATDELTRDAVLRDDTLAALRDEFDDESCRQLVLAIGWFNLLPRFLNGCRVPLETTDKIGDKTSPL
jgi:alkylhydroperoxidase family enzyme